MRAIISLSNKTGLAELASGLTSLQVELFSTGGTKKALQEAGIPAHSISELTGFPEIMDGRVKTLHPAVHGGILARRGNPADMEQLAQEGIGLIDLVAVNLYPFRQTIARRGVTLEEALENIDIGGPTMIRAAAKNFPDCIVLVDPADYGPVLEQLRGGQVSLAARKKLAQKAFQHVACYDTVIAQYLRDDQNEFPPALSLSLVKHADLSYGENPHQKAAFYEQEGYPGGTACSLLSAAQLNGKSLSYNNILDLDEALALVAEFEEPTVAIIKHNNPCGLASGEDLVLTYQRALEGDPLAAFGGILACNRTIHLRMAREIGKTHYDAMIAPAYDPEALRLLRRKKDLRLLTLEAGEAAFTGPKPSVIEFRQIAGGLLAQHSDRVTEEELSPRTVSEREPSSEEWVDLLFAWRIAKHVKSNAIVIAKDRSILGVGPGQPSRVASVQIALDRAGEKAAGAVLASDAFFPFTDGVELAAKAGIAAIIQPGGSVKDEEVIRTVDDHGMAMAFTGVRHFRH